MTLVEVYRGQRSLTNLYVVNFEIQAESVHCKNQNITDFDFVCLLFFRKRK